MKIENIKSYLVYSKGHRAGMIGGKSWLFVKVETDAGIHGWGEAYTQLDRDRSIQAHVEELGRYLVGRTRSTSSTRRRWPTTTMRGVGGRWSFIAR